MPKLTRLWRVRLALSLIATPAFAIYPAPPEAADAGLAVTAMHPLASVPNSAVIDFQSHVNGNQYRLFVFVPKDYEKSNRRYPVFYLLDGNAWQTAYGAIERLELGGEMPQIILVGIGYQGETMRDTDYPTVADSYWNVPKDRGAPVFLRVVKDEVIPRIEKEYRADPGNRALGGHSMGGYFTLYTLLNSPETFQRYWISSPSLPWDHYVILQQGAAYIKTHSDLRARVFVDEGELESEDVLHQLQALTTSVRSRHYPNLHWTLEIEHDLPHISVPQVALVYALYDLYGRPVVSVPATRLAAVAGTYRLPDHTTFKLTTNGHSLFLEDYHSPTIEVRPDLQRLRLLAESPDSFYARYIGLNFRIPADAGSPPARVLVSQQPAEDQTDTRASPTLTAERVSTQ